MLSNRMLLLLAILLAWLLAPASAAADPTPALGQDFPACGVAPDDDGRYCVESITRNGVPFTRPSSGPWDEPYIDLIGSGTVRFGVRHFTEDATAAGDVDPTVTWEVVVRSGAARPIEVFGHVRNVTFTPAGSEAAGWSWTLRFQPVPVAWSYYREPPCMVGACGDETTVADLVYDGFVTGYVTDDAERTEDFPGEIAQRAGFVHAFSAQDASQPYYDAATRSIVIQLANPHFRSPGVVARGSYETFIPNAMLTGALNVPDPASLTGGSFVVSRSTGGAGTAVPFTLTHTPAGIQIRISDITFSSPTYRIRARLMKPGAPRLFAATRASGAAISLGFRRPLANGGRPVLRYVARCGAPGRRARVASGTRSPLVVTGLAAGVEYRCTVRAVNALGIGSPSRTLGA